MWLPLSLWELVDDTPFDVRFRPKPMPEDDVVPEEDEVKLFPMLFCCDVILWLLNNGNVG